VEFLRFIFALGILFFHIHKRFAENGNVSIGIDGIYFFNHGYIGVEFFFLVSGYLLAAAAYAKRNESTMFIGTETALVMWKKIKKVFPYHLFAIILTIIVNAYYVKHTMKERWLYVVDSWASIFFLQVFGFDSSWVNKLTWYLDVWLMVTFIFWFFLRKYYETFAKIACPLMALFLLGYMAYKFDGLADIDDWTGHFYKCFLRGYAEMALGCSIYSITRAVNKIDFTKAGKKILAFLEVFCYFLAFHYAVTGVDSKYSFPTVFAMAVGLVLTFSDINPCHRIFDNPIFNWMGKMSLLIYLNQFYCIRLVQELMADYGFWTKTIASIVSTFIGAFLCDVVVTYINKTKPVSRLMLKREGE